MPAQVYVESLPGYTNTDLIIDKVPTATTRVCIGAAFNVPMAETRMQVPRGVTQLPRDVAPEVVRGATFELEIG